MTGDERFQKFFGFLKMKLSVSYSPNFWGVFPRDKRLEIVLLGHFKTGSSIILK